jgi:glycosyltransferase involved in cell wall biosynthesis
MPTLNGAAFLREALASVERENDSGIHCIVIDGGSTDETLSIANEFASRMPLAIHERADSPGWVWSTNRALEMAQSPHCCMLHQDDLWLPGRSDVLKDILGSAPKLALVAHSVRYVDRAGRDVGRLSAPWRAWPNRLEADEAVSRLLVQNFVSLPGAVFRTQEARACGGLDESLWYTADWDFWLKLARRGEVAYLSKDLAAFRLHPASQTARGSVDESAFRKQLETVLERHSMQVRDKASVRNAAALSVSINVALAQESHGHAADWGSIALQALRAGPLALLRFVRDSRLSARVRSRIRAGSAAVHGESLLAGAFRRHRVLRFLVVGVVNTLFSYAVYAAFVFGTSVRWASLVSLIAGILFGFLTQGKIVFLGFGKWSFLKFLLVWAALYHVFVVLVLLAESVGLNNYLGGAMATPVIAVLSYLLQSRFVFPSPQEGRSGGS